MKSFIEFVCEEKDFAKMSDEDLKNHINVRVRNGIAHQLSKSSTESLKAAQAELRRRQGQSSVQEEVELEEAIKLGSKVAIHDPGQSHHGKVGYVGEIRHGAYKGAPKTYTVDYDHDEETGRAKSVQLDKKNIKSVKEEVELDENWMPDYSKHSTEHLQKLLELGTLHKSESKYKMFIRRELKKRNLKQSNEEVELDEVAKPKGVVDKKFGKPEAPSKSGFKAGQRVAHYRGMGKTLHGDVTNPDVVSGGKKGAMVKFSHGSEFIPHSELKDASQYWKDEDQAMRKERDKKK